MWSLSWAGIAELVSLLESGKWRLSRGIAEVAGCGCLKVDCVEELLSVEGFQEVSTTDACGWLGSLHVDWKSQRREERKGSGRSQKGERPEPRRQEERRRRPQARGREDEGGREER